MADLPVSYTAGTVSVGAGSTTVTGSGTSWIAAGLQAGDTFWAAGLSVRIASVNSATSITLAYAWPGAALSGANYEVRYTPDLTRALAAQAQVLGQLTNGNIASIAALTTAADRLAYYTGAGAAALTPLTAAARTLLDDTSVSAMRATLGLTLAADRSDVTVGRVARVGDHGLGAAILLSGSQNLRERDLPTGSYIYNAGPILDAPETAAWTHVLQVFGKTSSSNRFYISSRVPSVLGGPHNMLSWMGWDDGAGGIAWTPIAAGGFLVGAVAQSGGVPTGAVMQRGSNGNGGYIRFAGGTQICWHQIQASTSADVTWAYPAVFSAVPENFASVRASSPLFAVVGTGSLTTSITFGAYTLAGGRSNNGTNLLAIGDWY